MNNRNEVNETTETTKPKRYASDIIRTVVLSTVGIACLVVIIVLVAKSCGHVSEQNKYPTVSGYVNDGTWHFYAAGFAQEQVEKKLQYPKNAEFEPLASMRVYYDTKTDMFTVKGYVYASNAFGVKEKMNFTVKAQLSERGDTVYGTNIDVKFME